MLFRTEIRRKVVELLKSHTNAAGRVFDSRVINWDAADLPGISVYTPAQRGTGYAAAQTPTFDSTLTLNIEIAVAEVRDWALKLDNLTEQIERLLLGNADFIREFQRVENYNVEIGFRSGGEKPVVSAVMSLELSYFEAFQPETPDAFEQVYIDLKAGEHAGARALIDVNE